MLESLGTARVCGDYVDRNTRLCSELSVLVGDKSA